MIVDYLNRRHHYAQYPAIYNKLCCLAEITAGSGASRIKSNNRTIPYINIISKPLHECVYEAHRNNIDIHLIVEGVEGIAIEDIDNLTETIPYNDKKDIAFYEPIEGRPASKKNLMPGMFLVCWPHEAHCTAIMQESPADIKKLVAKVKYYD